MVEVLAAALILAIVVTAVVTGISFSQRNILSESSQSDAAAQAQSLADTLVSKLHGAEESEAEALTLPGAARVEAGSFPVPAQDRQFAIESVHDGDGGDKAIYGYRIRTAVYYTDSTGRKCVQMTAFAAKDGDGE